MEEKESDGVKVDGEAMERVFKEALDTAVSHFSNEEARHRIMRLAKHGVSYAFALMGKIQADMLADIATTDARTAGNKERSAQHELLLAARSVIRPGTGLDARPPPEEEKKK